jgi:hypothetical protein
MPKVISNNDKKWQAEEDANAIKRFAECKNDKMRMDAANKVLKDEAMMTNKAMDLSMMSSAKKSPPKKSAAMMSGGMKPAKKK